MSAADGRGKGDLGVDVKQGVGTAWGPDDGGGIGSVVNEVVGGDGTLPGGAGGGLSSLSGEVVGVLLGTGDALVESGVSTVVGAEDGVLEATRVLDVQVELAVLAALGDGDAGADRGDVLVEYEGHDRLVGADGRCNGTAGAAGTSVCDSLEGDGSSRRILTGREGGAEGGTRKGEESSDLHVEGLFGKDCGIQGLDEDKRRDGEETGTRGGQHFISSATRETSWSMIMQERTGSAASRYGCRMECTRRSDDTELAPATGEREFCRPVLGSSWKQLEAAAYMECIRLGEAK